MTAERYQRINELADAVLEIPAAARDAYLSGACGQDPELRREVELLVQAHESTGGFLEQPAFERLAQELARNQDSPSLEGRQIGRYRVLSRLGSGGHGEVWLAEDRQLLRKVAIKLLAADLGTSPEHIRRLDAEARICSALNHPNIVTVYDTGELQGDAFLAQEYVEGQTLRRMLAHGPLPAPAAVEIVRQVANALEAAHAAGVVHRDIKPENIMIRPDGLVKVLDFGLAQFVESGTGDGGALRGVVMGTVRYMSPEQARGEPLDARTDIFSLGVVLFETLTGRTPFSASTPSETLAAIRSSQADLKDVPPQLKAVVRKCLAKDRDDRYGSAGEMRLALDLAMRVRHTGRRVMLAGALLVLAIAAFLAYGARTWAPAPFESMKISLLPTAGAAMASAISPDGKRVAYVLEEARGQSEWIRPLDSTVDTPLLQAEPGDHKYLSFSHDGAYLYYVRATAGGGVLYRIPASGGPAEKVFAPVNNRFALAPDGKRFAFIRLDEQHWEEAVIVAGPGAKSERTVAVRRRPQYYSRAGLAWSPDGKSLLCMAGNASFYTPNAHHLVRLDVATGVESSVGRHTWAWPNSLLWTADGRSLIVSANAHAIGALQVWHVSLPGGETRRITNDLSNYESLSQTADGKTLLAVRHDRTSDLMLARLGDPAHASRVSPPDLHDLTSAAWVSADRLVYSALGESAVNLWSIDLTGANRKQLTTAGIDQAEVETSRDGRYIFYMSGGRIWRVNADGAGARPLTPGPLDVHPAVTPDNRWLVYAGFAGWSPGIGGHASLWKIPIDGGEPVHLTSERTSCPSISPDGSRISCKYEQPGLPPQIAIYSIQGGPPLRIFDRAPATQEDHAYWTPDGKAVDYLAADAEGSRILRQMVSGGPPSEVAEFPGERLSFIRPSPDGRSVVFARGSETRELVLLRDVRE